MTKKGLCADTDGKKDVEIMLRCAKWKEEVEKGSKESSDDEVTIDKLPIGNEKLGGGNVKYPNVGSGTVVKTENVLEDVVDIECMDVENMVSKSAKTNDCGEERSSTGTVVEKKIGEMVRVAVRNEERGTEPQRDIFKRMENGKESEISQKRQHLFEHVFGIERHEILQTVRTPVQHKR